MSIVFFEFFKVLFLDVLMIVDLIEEIGERFFLNWNFCFFILMYLKILRVSCLKKLNLLKMKKKKIKKR